jgi:hypothetical protein
MKLNSITAIFVVKAPHLRAKNHFSLHWPLLAGR